VLIGRLWQRAGLFRLAKKIADDVIAIVGRRGRGKTTTAVVIVEELVKEGERVCVLDPIGVWYGLGSSRDGKGPGLPVIVMGGDHGHVALEETAGKVVAKFVAGYKGSVVLDLSRFRKGAMQRFAADFLEELYHVNRRGLHLVLDEADRFAPQRVMGETARLVGAAEDVCKMGRAHGLHPILITQRPAGLNKNVLELAGLLIAHALTGPNDRKALEGWVKENGTEEERAEFAASLPGLGVGVAWFWQPDAGIFERVEVRDRRTYDSSATPSGKARGPRVRAKVDLDKLKASIAQTIERAKADDPATLRGLLRQATDDLAIARRELGAAQARLDSPAPKTKAAPALKLVAAKRLGALLKSTAAAAARAGAIEARAEKGRAALSKVLGAVVEAVDRCTAQLAGATARAVITRSAIVRDDARAAAAAPVHRLDLPADFGSLVAKPHPTRKAAAEVTIAEPGLAALGKGPLVTLKAIASRPQGATPEALSTLAGYKKSTRNLNLQKLARSRFITSTRDGERIVWHATAAGRAALGPDFVPLPSGGEPLRRKLLEELPGPEAKVLAVAIAAYPNTIDRVTLGERAGYRKSTLNLCVQRLARRDAIEVVGPREVKAARILFEAA
jgi:uncharacterized protein